MHRHKTSRHPSPTDILIALAGWIPSPLHGHATRAVGKLSRRLFNVVITNVPGPKTRLYVGGARLLTLHPIVPLAHGQALSIGVLSYDGSLFYGLNADQASLPDLDRLAALIEPSLQQLAQTPPAGLGRLCSSHGVSQFPPPAGSIAASRGRT